jgi:hypothetical protein
MFEDYLITFLIGLLLGLASPYTFKRWILPKFSEWLQEKVDGWRKPSNPTTRKPRTPCPECGSYGKHKITCSRRKKK